MSSRRSFFLVCLFVLRTILGCRLSAGSGQLFIQDASTSLRLAQSIRAGPASVFQVKVSRHGKTPKGAPIQSSEIKKSFEQFDFVLFQVLERYPSIMSKGGNDDALFHHRRIVRR